jgi:hypothetical protein
MVLGVELIFSTRNLQTRHAEMTLHQARKAEGL